jgi:hypothetical protein
MKTPMQELIDIIKKRQEDDEAMPFMYNDKIIALAEQMLEKEKEQIIDAWMDDRFPLDKDWVKQCAEQYYNETFNTKER